MTAYGINFTSSDLETFFEQIPTHPTTETTTWGAYASELFDLQDAVLTTRENRWVSDQFSADLLAAANLFRDAGMKAERGNDPTDDIFAACVLLGEAGRTDLVDWHIRRADIILETAGVTDPADDDHRSDWR